MGAESLCCSSAASAGLSRRGASEGLCECAEDGRLSGADSRFVTSAASAGSSFLRQASWEDARAAELGLEGRVALAGLLNLSESARSWLELEAALAGAPASESPMLPMGNRGTGGSVDC